VSVVVVGIEHRTAPLELLERVSVLESELPKVLGKLSHRVNLQESVLLSTCLRTEVYAVVDRFHEGVSEVQELLADQARLPVEDIEPNFEVQFDDDVATHLFSVAAGLESAVLGEPEVLGQVRHAWERAEEERVCGPVLARLFRHALRTGKRARTETGISRGTISFAHAAVELSARNLDGGLRDKVVVVTGAGELGKGLVRALVSLPADRRPSEVLLTNRTVAKAQALASSSELSQIIKAIDMAALPQAIETADLLLSAVEADAPIIDADQLASESARGGRPLLVVDLGMPRNVRPSVEDLPGVTLLDMDDLKSSVDEASKERHAEVDEVRSIVAEEVGRYRADSRARSAAPVIGALRARLEGIRVAEVERRRGSLPEDEWRRLDEVTRATMAKLLHEPTILLKETAGTPRGERLVEALRNLFDL